MAIIDKFNGLEHLGEFIVKNIDFDKDVGFRFHEVYSGMSLEDAMEVMGDPSHLLVRRENQQSAEYLIPIFHAEEGVQKNKFVRLLLLAFNREPIKIIELKLNFPRHSIYADAYSIFIKKLINELTNDYGEPSKKSLRKKRELLHYKFDLFTLHLWYAKDGLRIQFVTENNR